MSDLKKNYDESKMTWNVHDREFHKEQTETIYHKVAEVVIAQNDRFFKELEKHDRRIAECEDNIGDHECRIRKLERESLMRRTKKYAIIAVVILVSLFLTSYIML